MLTDILLWVVFVIMLVIIAVPAVETKVGRHRGVYTFRQPWVRGLDGQHHGEYVEKPQWRKKKPDTLLGNSLIWQGTVASNIVPQLDVATIDSFWLTPPENAIATLPILIGGPDNESYIRDIVNDELNATPIYTGIKYGRFGDSDIDLADPEPLCITVSTRMPED